MCGRFLFSSEENDEIRDIVNDVQRRFKRDELNFVMAGDVHPTAASPVLVANDKRIVTEIQRWGLPRPQGSGCVINARAETALERPMFRSSVLERRCVIVANAFYEWDKAKYQYIFRPLNGGCLYMAGLFDHVEGINCFVILTTAANASMQSIHDRMPLILQRNQVRPWLTEQETAVQMLGVVPPLLDVAAMDGQMRMW